MIDPLESKRLKVIELMTAAGKAPTEVDRKGILAQGPEVFLDDLIDRYTPAPGGGSQRVW